MAEILGFNTGKTEDLVMLGTTLTLIGMGVYLGYVLLTSKGKACPEGQTAVFVPTVIGGKTYLLPHCVSM